MFGSLLSSFDTNVFDEFRRLENEMDQLFGRTAWPAGIRAVRRGTFPPINVGSTPERVDVYLFAAGNGLATVIRAWIDRSAIADALGLTHDQQVLLSQTVGFAPKR